MYTKTLSFSYVFLKKLAAVAIVAGAFFFSSSAFASTGHNTTGYAWSANIGAISFNCTSQPGGCDAVVGGGGGVLEVPEVTPPAEDEDGAGGLFGVAPTPGVQKAISLISKVRTHIARFMQDEVTTKTAYADFDDLYLGSNYGVSVDPATGIMSGYAWSPYVGWISFEESVGCPEGSCTPTINLANGDVSGWIKVLSATDTAGWDGWISLSCKNHSILPCGSYKVSYDSATGNLSGYAWGDRVVGWVRFSGDTYAVHVDLDQPIVTLTASDTEFCPDDNSITLTWNAVGTGLSCTASSIPLDTAFTGPIATSGTAVVTPTAPTTYSISCTSLGGTDAYQQTVSVALGECGDSDLILSAEPAPAQCTGAYRTDLSIYSPNSTTFMSCSPVTSIPAGPTYPITGAPNPGNGYTVVVPDVLVHTNPTVFQTTCYEPDATPLDMTDNPSMLVQTSVARACAAPRCDFTSASVTGEPLKASLTWTSSGGTGAGLTASGGWSGTKAFSGSQSGIAFTSPETTYTLTVTNPDGLTDTCTAVLNKSVIGDPVCDPDPNDPNGDECDVEATITLTATPDELGVGGGNTTLEWNTTDIVPDSCVAYSWPSIGSWVGVKDDEGTDTVLLTSSTNFRVQCKDGYDGSYISDDVTVIVEGTPTECTVDGVPPPKCPCTDPLECPTVRTKPWYIER